MELSEQSEQETEIQQVINMNLFDQLPKLCYYWKTIPRRRAKTSRRRSQNYWVTLGEPDETNCNYFEMKEIYVFVITMFNSQFERSTLLNIVMRTIE